MGSSFMGWDAHILSNDRVRIVLVPALGGRVMAFDLGDHGAIWVNPALAGQSITPDPEADWPNVGGYKTWPAPPERWGGPPPPLLDHGPYDAIVNRDPDGTITAHLAGPIERWRTPGLRFERTLTLRPGSARLQMVQTLINTGTQPQQWGIWDITQHRVESYPGAGDHHRYRVYFPVNPRSLYGVRGVRVSAESPAWLGKVAQGVFGVSFRPENQKIYADCDPGWIAYTDQFPQGGVAYVKLFAIDPAAAYPDGGARIEVWNNQHPVYLEVEILGPLVDLAPGGGQTTLIETWGACVYGGGVIRRASQAGVVAERLVWDAAAHRLSGRGGVFECGHAQVAWLDRDGEVICTGPSQPADPFEPLNLDLPADPPTGATAAEVYVIDAWGEIAGVWDRAALE